MDFKSKLATLPRPNPGPSGDADASPATAPGRASTLDELRQKMAQILEAGSAPFLRPTPPPQDPNEPHFVLPFEREERESGPLFRRHQTLPPSHHVGRMPVDAAASSRAELLGLL